MTDKEKCIAIINNDCINKSDAIILLEGDGYNRCDEAVRLFHEGYANIVLFSGGIVDYSYGSFPFADIQPYLLKRGIPRESILHEDKSLNTKEQAEEVLKIACVNNWKRLILVASPEHQYRAYMTFLREIIDLDKGIVLYNSTSKNLKWCENLGWGQRFERLNIEFERIEKYSEFGHLATYKEVIKYQEWKEQQ